MSHNCQGDQAEGLGQATQANLCANGCGFFANPACNNMCSKCYRDAQMASQRKASNSKAAALSDVGQLSEIKDVLAAEKTAEAAQISAAIVLPPIQTPDVEAKVAEPSPDPPSVGTPEPTSTSTGEEPPQRPVQKNPGRCFVCNKKVGLTGFKCRCDYVFCGAHRLAEAHECSFDYKQLGRQRLAENNPLVQASKMDKL